ncbi:hypothetical protein Lalb_Chr21g0313531 [Lupinus albus]|uniref:Uncharacterized protein n=1 Tax=Lupinus albus TaxID=3870 RepID=A0A6A4ND19_LUPAL|nr:hypothetical protein Lalb_Chr21g0313531 [Lupinus albus]
MLIPWIVRGEDGNLKLQSHAPSTLMTAMVTAETGTKTKTKQKEIQKQKKMMKKKGENEDNVSSSVTAPRHSKAARRFYNQNLRDRENESDAATRLSKVLAASGGT